MELYDYQVKFVEGISNLYRQGFRSPLGVLPTGGGKTVCFSHIATKTTQKPKPNGAQRRVWIMMHRVELVRQTYRALVKMGQLPGVIHPQFSANYRSQIQVASIQTLVKRLGAFEHPNMRPDLIIIDEAHHAVSPTYRKIINTFPEAFTLGVTATPIRGDGKGLGVNAGGVFDSMIVGAQTADLIAMGKLVKPLLFRPPGAITMDGVDVVRGDYDKAQAAERVDKPTITGDAIAHYRKYCDGAPAVVFCANVQHAEHVAAQFRQAGYRAWSVDGTMDDDVRKSILGGLETREVQVVTSCDLISEGTDIPRIAAAFLIRPTKSTALYLQQVGRALRVCEGKTEAMIFDHVGNWVEHGLPEAIREWSLDGEVKGKKRKTNEAPPVRFCPECYIVHASHLKVCPHCDFVYPRAEARSLEQVEGELVLVTEEEANLIKYNRKKEIWNAKTEEDLILVAHKYGYKPGWVKHMMKSREAKAKKN